MLGKLPSAPKAPETTQNVQIAALPQRIGVKVSDTPQGVQEDELADLSAAVQQLQGQKPGPAASLQTASKGFSLRNRHHAATLSVAMEEPSERSEREPTMDAEALSEHRPVLSQDVQQMVANLEATITALEAAGEDVLNNPEVQEVVAQATALLAGIEAETEHRTHPLPEPMATRAREVEAMDTEERERDADAEFPEEPIHRSELLAFEEREEHTVPADEDLQAAAALMAEEDDQEPHMPDEELLHMDVDLAAVGPARSRQWTKLQASIDNLPGAEVSISANGQAAPAKVAASSAAAVAGPVKPAAKATAAAQPQAAVKPSVAAARTVDVSATELTQLLSDLSALVDAAESASAKQA